MKRRLMVGTMVAAASMLASGAAHAAPVDVHSPVHGMFSKAKMVNFNVRNDSKQSITVKAGEKEITIEPGKTASVKLAVGEKIVAQADYPNYPAGSVLATATSDLGDATVVLR